MAERIPQEELDANQLRFERRIAAMLLHALAESDVVAADVDARIGRQAGYLKRFIGRLIDGKTGVMKESAMLLYALGAEFDLMAVKLPLETTIETDAE